MARAHDSACDVAALRELCVRMLFPLERRAGLHVKKQALNQRLLEFYGTSTKLNAIPEALEAELSGEITKQPPKKRARTASDGTRTRGRLPSALPAAAPIPAAAAAAGAAREALLEKELAREASEAVSSRGRRRKRNRSLDDDFTSDCSDAESRGLHLLKGRVLQHPSTSRDQVRVTDHVKMLGGK